MSYCHRNKSGNQGDLIKHLALTGAIYHMAISNTEFSYLDVHAGHADYELDQDGAWRDGIGHFVKLYAGKKILNEDVDYFYRLHSLSNLDADRRYWGSSKIISTALRDKGINRFRLHLCDTSPEVCASLRQSYAELDNVHIYCEDGYRRAKTLTGMDLVFIDPPDMGEHFPAYLDLVRHCLHRGQPFIAWNSLHGEASGEHMSTACQTIHQLANSTGTTQIAVKWRPGWPETMCGCQMLLGLQGAEQLRASCQSLARLMQWETLS